MPCRKAPSNFGSQLRSDRRPFQSLNRMITNTSPSFPNILCAFIGLALLSDSLAQETAAPPDTASADVRSSITYDLGDRLFTVQRVTEETIPIRPSPPAPKPAAPSVPHVPTLAEIAEAKRYHFLNMGGMTYLTESGSVRSLITWYSGAQSQPLVFWSSIDWDLLRPGNFTSPEGETYSLLLMLFPGYPFKELHGGTDLQPPEIPSFPSGAATYQIVSGAATPDMIATLNALHSIHDSQYQSLVTLRQQREEAWLAAAQLPQPPPEDIVSQYREMTQEELKNR